MTQKMLRFVGRGTGPDTRAPERSTVSTMRFAERSTTSWSKAFSLIRMRIVVAGADMLCPIVASLRALATS